MSVVICYSCKGFSMIATDTRLCCDKDGSEYTDDNFKLQTANKGFSWAAGAGASFLINQFITFTNKVKVNNLEELQKLFNITHVITGKQSNYDEKTLHRTAVAISMFHLDSSDMFPIYVWSKSFGDIDDNVQTVNKNTFFPLLPTEYLNNENKYNDFKNEFTNISLGDENDINQVLKHTCRIFEKISENSNSVSKTIDIGITCADIGDIYRLQLRCPVSELLMLDEVLEHTNAKVVWRLTDTLPNDKPSY